MDLSRPGALQVLRVRTPGCARHRWTSRHRCCHITYPPESGGENRFSDMVIKRSTCRVSREVFGPSEHHLQAASAQGKVPRERGFTCVEWLGRGGARCHPLPGSGEVAAEGSRTPGSPLRHSVWPGCGPEQQPASATPPPQPHPSLETKDKAGTQPDTPRSPFIAPLFASSPLSSGSLCPFWLSASLFTHIFRSVKAFIEMFFFPFASFNKAFVRNPHTAVPLQFPYKHSHNPTQHVNFPHPRPPPPFSLWCACLSSCRRVWAPHQTSCLTNND